MDLVKMFEKSPFWGKIFFFKFIFSKSKFIEFSKFQNLTFLKLGESYDSAIFYEQTDRQIDVFQANVPDVRQATQNPTMLRNLTFKALSHSYIESLTTPSRVRSEAKNISFQSLRKKKHHLYRCKMKRWARKWHPFELKIYRIQTKKGFQRQSR